MDITQRIAQFENMVQADPNNDMAHFSLGRVYAEAGRWREAGEAFLSCIARNKDMSKAYELAGNALIQAGDKAKAAEVLRVGYKSAGERGDRMPQRAMGDLLTKLGEALPKVEGGAAPAAVDGGTFVCRQSGRAGHQMPRPPFKGPVGLWIHENISKETFDTWIAQGTKVINELRLDLSRDEDAASYDKHMRDFLGIDDDLFQKLSAGR